MNRSLYLTCEGKKYIEKTIAHNVTYNKHRACQVLPTFCYCIKQNARTNNVSFYIYDIIRAFDVYILFLNRYIARGIAHSTCCSWTRSKECNQVSHQ